MKNLYEMRNNLASLKPLENRASRLADKLYAAEDKVKTLLEKYEKECLDVERMQKAGFSSFVLQVLGKFDKTLEKKKREANEAKINYDLAMSELSEIRQEKHECSLKLTSLRQLHNEYQNELDNRKKHFEQNLSPDAAAKYKQYKEENDALSCQAVEVKEAISAVIEVKLTAESAQSSLKSARNWATYDIWAKGGIISHSAKYSHIDAAESCFNRLTSQINHLKEELNDIYGLSMANFTEVSSSQRTIDFWFDNIFTDISVHSQISENMEKINRLIGGLNKLESMLNGKSRDINARIETLNCLQEELLISF